MSEVDVQLGLHRRQTVACNELFATEIKKSQHFELLIPPSLALSVFRLVPRANSTLEELNDLNKKFYTRLSSRKDIALTQTVLNGVSCLRFAVGSARTTDEHIHKAVELLNSEAEQVLNSTYLLIFYIQRQ